ncbi:MAG: ATP-binding protein [Muribaculaceae bacterium]|nr:ATP-binding protein [Muribaculaceae bacterium]
MAQYNFSISDYHSIDYADIKLDGITVIAGCNGSGKSTIARWIYSFVNYTNDFYHLVDEQLVNRLESKLYSMYRILRNIDCLPYPKLRQFKTLSVDFKVDIDYSEIEHQFRNRVGLFCDIVDNAIRNNDNPSFDRWISQSLGCEEPVSSEYLSEFYRKSLNILESSLETAYDKKKNCHLDELFQFIQRDLDLITDLPKNIKFEENGHNLISNNRFLIPISLGNAIYIDTPMALSTKVTTENKIWDGMMNALTTPLREMPYNARRIAVRIRRLMGGWIEVQKEDMSDTYDIRYIRKSDNLNISINEAATGLKTFAYMLRLIENGYLNEHSILLIDEPEAHLHPQWIVEFARILVLLHKEVGTTILLASHNPDMVAALKSISEAEEINNKISFYQAKLDDDTQRYTYQYLGNDIEGIFESFNIALNRIKDYGC